MRKFSFDGGDELHKRFERKLFALSEVDSRGRISQSFAGVGYFYGDFAFRIGFFGRGQTLFEYEHGF